MPEKAPTMADTAVALAAALPRFVRVSADGLKLQVAFSTGVIHSFRLNAAPTGLLDDLLAVCQQIEWFVELANVPVDHGGNSEWIASVNEPLDQSTSTARTYASPVHALMAAMVAARKIEATR